MASDPHSPSDAEAKAELSGQDDTLANPQVLSDSGKVKLNTERYELLEVLGRGGMGEVRKAYDPDLGRFIALKLLRNTTADQAQRLMQEARAQARVDHPHICKVYGVGELDGQPFLAIQFVNGKTLREAGREMTRPQLVRVMLQVADALHAAHRQGLIHRDVKPTNILIEKTDSGNWVPYVADFGLAREVEAAGVTASGAAGTPLYMAPDQARGDVKKLDCRSDVYSLGATLYELLAGRPPFQGDSALAVMLKAVHEEALPLRKIDSSIPADLETIVMKALEKEPARRYDTARAFAEDLQRYLDGEPIYGRRASLGYRLSKRARKHLGLVVAASIAILIAAVFGGYAVRTRRLAAQQGALAQRFGQEVAQMMATARIASLMPLHDLRPEMSEIRRRMSAVETQMGKLGTVAAGPGHYALGRGYLILERYDEALRELDAAWATGFRSPALAYALGMAHSKLYERALAELRKSGDEKLDAARRDELARVHRDPALRYLKDVQLEEGEAVDAPEYVEALIALDEQRFGEAHRLAQTAAKRASWLFEARTLDGDIYFTAGKQRSLKGDIDGALEQYQRARETYRAVAEVAHSSSAAHLGECREQLEVLGIQIDRDHPPDADVQVALSACAAAATTRPDDAAPLVAQASAWGHLGHYQSRHGVSPVSALE
jgi:serine/threonine-protein kinase